jgi:formylglycine-generating enzyme required for sulfatase activity
MIFFRSPDKSPVTKNALRIRFIVALIVSAVAIFGILLPLVGKSIKEQWAHKETGTSPSPEQLKKDGPSLRSSWGDGSLTQGKGSASLSTRPDTGNDTDDASEKHASTTIAAPSSSYGDNDTALAKNKKNSWSKEDMVWVKAGTFAMGSADGQDDEKPVHQVNVHGFYLDKAEVTQEEFKRAMHKNPSYFKNCPACPVENVTWNDARKYCETIGKRLPREEEWEYACRAGTSTKFPWGDSPDGKYAWYHENADFKTHPVKSATPNAWGLYDMTGNVWEWCGDLWRPYPGSVKGNPDNHRSSPSRIIRGGAWDKSDYVLRSSARGRFNPEERSNNIGFRCAH